MINYKTFRILPILGRKTDVPPNDLSLFKFLGEGIAATHDVGGINYNLSRKRNSCSRALGYVEFGGGLLTFSEQVVAQESADVSPQDSEDVTITDDESTVAKCMGLFELRSGSNTDHLYFDFGKVLVLNASNKWVEVEAATPMTFSFNDVDLYSIIRVGEYVVFSDRGTTIPYVWSNGDANIIPLIKSGNDGDDVTADWIVSFARRVILLGTNATNGDIEIRWTDAWPTAVIGDTMSIPTENQLYVPNDDSIMCGHAMGSDKCFVYCKESIHQLVYTGNSTSPFAIYTSVTNQGTSSPLSVVPVGDRHFLFNKNFGFCEYRGGSEFPYGGKAISYDIEEDVKAINSQYYSLIYGRYIPETKEVVWSVPVGTSYCNLFYYYNTENGNWRIESKTARCIDTWTIFSSFTWNDLIDSLGGSGATWSMAGNATWGSYVSAYPRTVFAGAAGKLYYISSNTENGSDFEGYRIEPVMDFGTPELNDIVQEIWVDMGQTGTHSIDFYHRGGNTVGETISQTWDSVGSITCDSPSRARMPIFKNSKYHQIKWGTDLANEPFEINSIQLKYVPETI